MHEPYARVEMLFTSFDAEDVITTSGAGGVGGGGSETDKTSETPIGSSGYPFGF